jgi:hypothetical protein
MAALNFKNHPCIHHYDTNDNGARGDERSVRMYDPSLNTLFTVRGNPDIIIQPFLLTLQHTMLVEPYCKSNPDPKVDEYTIVAAVVGTHSDAEAMATYGVYLGNECNYNEGGTVLGDMSAETAILHAMNIFLSNTVARINRRQGSEQNCCRVLILSDCEDFVKGIAERVWDWKGNKWRHDGTIEIMDDGDLWSEVHEWVLELESRRIPVQFWHVPGAEILQGAYALARGDTEDAVSGDAENVQNGSGH